jgi:hypothetical protein
VDALVSALAERTHLFGAAAVDECSVLKVFQEDSLMLARLRRGERESKPAPGGPARCRAPDPDDLMSPEWWVTIDAIQVGDSGRGVVEIYAQHPGEFRRESYSIGRSPELQHSFVTESRIGFPIATNDYQELIPPKDWPGYQQPVSSADSLRAEAVIEALRTRAAMFGPGIVSRCSLAVPLRADERLTERVAATTDLRGTRISDTSCVRPERESAPEDSWWIEMGMLAVVGSSPRRLYVTAYRGGARRESYVFDRAPGKLHVTEVRIEP